MQQDSTQPKGEESGWRCTTEDPQLQEEIRRMQQLRISTSPATLADWRLASEPFMNAA